MTTCPNCRTRSDGAYCPSCGTALGGRRCRSCGAALQPDARYCTQCGKATRAVRAGLPWLVAAGAALALVAVVVVGTLTSDRAPRTAGESFLGPAEGADAAGGGTGMGPLSGDMRENADRLFNRVMQAQSEGNAEEAAFFAPMGVQAYQASGPLDADGRFHLSLLQRIAGDAPAARRTAEQVLATSPDHLLALAAAAEAAEATGDADAAGEYWRRFLAAYDAEAPRDLPEYRDHEAILPAYRAQAEAFGGRAPNG